MDELKCVVIPTSQTAENNHSFLRYQWVTNWDLWKECIDIKENMVGRERNTNLIYSHLFIWEDNLELKFITCLRVSGKNL